MDDSYRYAADVLRQRDPDRYLANLFAPEDARRHLCALHAFDTEIAGIRDVVSDPLPGEIRLQWWRDVIAGTGEPAGNPLAEALMATIRARRLPVPALERLLDARLFDLYDDPMPSLTNLEGYAGETASAILQLGAIVLAGEGDPGTAEAAGHGGVALTLTAIMRRLPVHARRRQLYLPADRMAAHGVDAEGLFAGEATPGLAALLAELRALARRHLAGALRHLRPAPAAVLPAFLPLALVEPGLAKLEKSPPFEPAELARWRRQWLLWRAARRFSRRSGPGGSPARG